MRVQDQMEKLRVRRAAELFEELRGGDAPQATEQELQGWLAESPLNNHALLKVTALSRELREAAREAGLRGVSLIPQLKPAVIPFGPSSGAAVGSPRSALRRWTTGLVAVAAALLGFAVWLGQDLLRTERFITVAGEERTLNLADGSVVYVNARSRVQVRMTDTGRDIHLDGEALFEVAHDAQRPFRVHTREAVVRAVGTQFNVATRDDGTRVAVVEGKVQVSSEATSMPVLTRFARTEAAEPTALKAGEAVRVSPSGAVERRPAAEAANALAWREHLVIIDGMALEDAIEEFNKYQRTVRLRLEDVAPKSHHYSGTFDAKDPASFADFLSHERDLAVEKRGDEILIRERR